MRIFFIFILLLLALRLCAVPYNTNSVSDVAADNNGLLAWPTDPIADSISLTNYAGGNSNLIVISGGANPISYTNYTTHAGFTLHQNGHFTIFDQYQATWQTGTNGVLSITQTNGYSFIVSNGIAFELTADVTTDNITYQHLANGTYFLTNAWNLASITNGMSGLQYWSGPSNRSFVLLQYNNGAIAITNLFYQP